MTLRRFEPEDAQDVSALIAKTLRTTNSRDYSSAYIEKNIALRGYIFTWRAKAKR